MSEKREKEPEPRPEIFDVSWEIDSGPEEDDQEQVEPESDENDVEGHAGGGFNRPE